jgi:hypothetical protein
MIEVLSFKRAVFDKRDPTYIQVCRPSPLGNPFHIGADGDRDAVCEKYAGWLTEQLKDRTSPQLRELARIYRIYKEYGRLYLFCWCAPERCHAEFIKFVLNGGLKQ